MSQTTDDLTLPAVLKAIDKQIAILGDCAMADLFPMPHVTPELLARKRKAARKSLAELAEQAEALGDSNAAREARRAAEPKSRKPLAKESRSTPDMYRHIAERVGAIARDETKADNLVGSTTIRLAVGLIVGDIRATNENFHGDERSAWDMLDRVQREAVRDMNPKFRQREWNTPVRVI